MQAYNIDTLQRSVVAGEPGDGWVFGLPPGISTAQWPLDPHNGYPLMHGFTIRLPEDYRVHGPGIVALSFFATAADHNDGVPTVNKDIQAILRNPAATRPDDPELVPFWESLRETHPRLHRMGDILDLEYAVILLTEAEFSGAPAEPPRREGNGYLSRVPAPLWLSVGAAQALWRWTPSDDPQQNPAWPYLHGEPPAELGFNRALRLVVRESDPNAGKSPREPGTEATGYQSPFYFDGEPSAATYRQHKWTKTHQPNHIGGTMQPMQGIPPMSPYYLEFDEGFGGYNFGTGNAQLDFRDMVFDWAQ